MKFFKTILCVILILFLNACMPNYSEGSRTGVVTKISHKGIIFKSWEGQLNQGRFRNQTDANGNISVVANVLNFNVQNPNVVIQLQDAMKSGRSVELVYSQYFISPLTQDSSYVITAVN